MMTRTIVMLKTVTMITRMIMKMVITKIKMTTMMINDENDDVNNDHYRAKLKGHHFG